MAEPLKRYPRPIGDVFEDGSYRTVGGKIKDAETGKIRSPHQLRRVNSPPQPGMVKAQTGWLSPHGADAQIVKALSSRRNRMH